MKIESIGVIGGGTMGNGIAHVFALKGFQVVLVERSEELASKAIKSINSNLERQLKKGLIDEKTKEAALSNLTSLVGLENIPKDTDLVIEAIYEDKQAKMLLFNRLQSIINADSIFASNTSSISITELASASRPDRFIGMHFMNPVPLMKLVEIIKGYSTSSETVDQIKDVTHRLEKIPVEVNDYPGFIANRILMPMINEAVFALMEGVASAENIDAIMKLGMNHPMGPLTLADFIGLDVCLAIMEVLYTGYKDSKYRPCPLLKKMVAANKLGTKTGEGFFKYN